MNKLSEEQHNVLIGLLLGDGSLIKCKNSKNPRLSIDRSARDLGYLTYQFNLFRDICTPERKIHLYSRKQYNFCQFSTRSCEILDTYYREWYPERKKIIPRNLVLTPLSIAIWFADDGSIRFKSKDGLLIRFCTDGFKKEEVEFLAGLLINRYGEKFDVQRTGRNSEKYRIIAYDKTSREMCKDIDSIFPESMNRKAIWRGTNLGKYE